MLQEYVLSEKEEKNPPVINMNSSCKLPPVGVKVYLLVNEKGKFIFVKALRTAYAGSYDASNLYYDVMSEDEDGILEGINIGRRPWVYATAMDVERYKNLQDIVIL